MDERVSVIDVYEDDTPIARYEPDAVKFRACVCGGRTFKVWHIWSEYRTGVICTACGTQATVHTG